MGAAAFVGAVILTLLVRRWALENSFFDQPGERKIHDKPIALGGGIVIFWVVILPVAGAVIAAMIFQRIESPSWLPQILANHIDGLASRSRMAGVLIISAGVLHLIGLIDDRKHLGPWIKLAVQFAVALFITTVGQIRFSLFIPNPILTTTLSVLWIVVIVNAFNFLDNMDGLSAGIATICSMIILSAALASGQVFVSSLLALLIGALLGFLMFNFAPAKIFMGDAGSLLVGMLVAVATIRTTYYHQGAETNYWYSAFIPLVALAVPLYDFISVTLLRFRQGKSPFVGDKQHFSHRLVSRGMSVRQAVLTIYLATACTGLGATFLHQVSTTGAILIFGQTLLIVLIIAILEQPLKFNDENPHKNHG